MELSEILTVLGAIVALIGGFFTLWRKISALGVKLAHDVGAIRSDLANGLNSISALMNSYGLLLGVLSTKKGFTAAEIQGVQKPYLEYAQGAIQQLLSRVKAGNPITASELEKIKAYVARSQRCYTIIFPHASCPPARQRSLRRS